MLLKQELEEQVRSMTASHNSTMSKERQYGKELDLQSRKLEDQIRQLQMKIKVHTVYN
jgi:hypothetical protein